MTHLNLETLYESLRLRKRPEDIAAQIILNEALNEKELLLLNKAASGALRNQVWQYTSMLEKFAEVSGAQVQVSRAIQLFKTDDAANKSACDDPLAVEAFLAKVSALIHKNPGYNNYETDRLNREARQAAGLDISRRQYNKLFRCLRHLEKKLDTMVREYRKSLFQRVGKHAFAEDISREDFMKDVNSACFIAYYTARGNLRSQFTVQGQQRPYDEIADMLLMRCWREPETANWWAIAQVYPTQEVLGKLSPEQQGLLLGKWTTLLQQVAAFLEELWQTNDFNRQTMVVRRGNDSSTWNNIAGAWNKARDGWMNLIYALGMEFILEEMCFGKVMRLIAADVAASHYLQGHDGDPNLVVWNWLPLPWEVLSGKATCNRERVVAACKRAGLDPERSGWIAPRIHQPVPFLPTPELVHGVTVSNPYLATLLKQHKYFSGKGATPLFPEQN
ncbi:hypothetical protein [Chitinophaga varians]|uniref:hypothetical protein n=1 Tax=Chitinophaga varians TaxID=2202339 RepID=UPI00165EE219|nr:hypothetical protein [Chitinophaga varians]MBC9909179.1 hypothetical protein [Chitinophaga varians]